MAPQASPGKQHIEKTCCKKIKARMHGLVMPTKSPGQFQHKTNYGNNDTKNSQQDFCVPAYIKMHMLK